MYDYLKACDEAIRRTRDEDLIAEWEEARRREEADPSSMDTLRVWDRYRTGAYYLEKRQRVMREKAGHRRARAIANRRAGHDEDDSAALIGDAIAWTRRRAGLSQQGLADATGLSRNVLSHIERGRKKLAFDEACRIADALGITLEQLRPSVTHRLVRWPRLR